AESLAGDAGPAVPKYQRDAISGAAGWLGWSLRCLCRSDSARRQQQQQQQAGSRPLGDGGPGDQGDSLSTRKGRLPAKKQPTPSVALLARGDTALLATKFWRVDYSTACA